MNRNERRSQKALLDKKEKWIRSWVPYQKDCIREVLQEARIDEEMKIITNLDTVITGALVEKTDLTIKEIFEINVLIGKYYGEINFENSKKGMQERMDGLKKIQDEVLGKIEEMIRDGAVKKVIVKAMREEYKSNGLTTAEINTAYKKVQEKLEAEELENAARYIIGEDELKVEDKACTGNKKIAVEIKKESKLRVINEVTKVVSRDVQGEFGIYHLEGNVMQVNEDYAFTSKEEIKTWASEEREELFKKIAHINACECEALEVIEIYMNV